MINNPQSLNLATVIDQSTLVYPNKTAIIFNDTKYTYLQINELSNKVANGLKEKGFKKGDSIALSCPNLPFFPVIYYAILKIGGVVVPLNVLLKRDEIQYHLEDSNSKAYFCFMGTSELPMAVEGKAAFDKVDECKEFWVLTPTPEIENPISGTNTIYSLIKEQKTSFISESTNADDIAVLLYTSGTTGKPKGAALTHSNLFQNAFISQSLVRATSDDINLITLPLFHSFGQTVQMNCGFLSGLTMVLIPKFDPDVVLASFEKHDVTLFAGVPTMYWALLNHPDKNKYNLEKISKNLRVGTSGGSAMPVEVLKGFQEAFKIPILEGYGLSETSPVACFTRIDIVKKLGSIGVPIVGVEMKLVDENGNDVDKAGETGEVVIRGHNIMKEYYGKPEETAEVFKNGWFHSGDIGRKDEDGYYYIVDRIKDMIIRGGFNVYPSEIEEVLMTHPAVSLVAVIGIKNEQYGEEIKAFIIKKPDAVTTEDEIIKWSKEKMAAYKYPRIIEFRESLPMTSTGKILKRELRE